MAEVDAFSSDEARSLAQQLAVLIMSRSKGTGAAVASMQSTLTDHPNPSATPTFDPRSARLSGPREPQRPRGRLSLLVAALVLALGLAGAGLVRVVGQSRDGSPPLAGTLVSAESKSGQDAAGSTAEVDCWDGQTAFSLSGCGTPAGLRGLVWVFPSIQPETCVVTGGRGRKQAWSCSVGLGGTGATIVYRELVSVANGINRYDTVYANGAGLRKAVGSRYVWKAKQPDLRGIWRFSSMYVAKPWSVHVKSTSRQGAKLAFRSVEFRAFDQWQGEVASD